MIPNWLSLSQTAGTSGITTITVTASTYDELLERSTSLKVRAADKDVYVNIAQSYNPNFRIEPMSFTNVSSASTSLNARVVSDSPWTVFSTPDWCSVSPSSGAGGQGIVVNVSSNTGSTRNGAISFIQSGTGIVRNLSISQLNRKIETLSVSPKVLNLPAESGSSVIFVTSSGLWGANTSTPWVGTISPSVGESGTTAVTINYSENEGTRRTGSITFSNMDKTEVVTISQVGIQDVDNTTPFTIEFYSAGTLEVIHSMGLPLTLQYSVNRGETEEIEFSSQHRSAYISVSDGDKIRFWGNAGLDSTEGGPRLMFRSDSTHEVYGNAYSLLTSNYENISVFTGDTLMQLFSEDKGLVSAHNLILPAIELGSSVYSHMFSDCTNLVYGPELPATTLGYNCYAWMFNNCESLTEAPILPALIVPDGAYSDMFRNCTNLAEAPQLPATNVAQFGYASMFEGCSSIRTAPSLPATVLEMDCYDRMFADCVSLLSSPALPASNVPDLGYADMFLGCKSLSSIGNMSATTLGIRSCSRMFGGCTSLNSTPDLNFQTISTGSCQYMFEGCTGISLTASALPATTLYTECYKGMYEGCTSLVTAPALPAETLVMDCYSNMFSGCSSLSDIKCFSITGGGINYCYDWVEGVSPTGTFTKNSEANWVEGDSGIPDGWTVLTQ